MKGPPMPEHPQEAMHETMREATDGSTEGEAGATGLDGTPSLEVPAVRLSPILSVKQTAAHLGLPGKGRTPEARLRRYIERRERLLGVEIFVPVGVGSRSVVRLTVARLRQYCPELFDTRAEALETVRVHMERMEEKFVVLQQQDELLAKAVARLGR